MVRGSCLCGNVSWQATGAFTRMSHCHCSICRKLHGTGFATYCATEADGFHWRGGKDSCARYESSPGVHRTFCTSCGSVVPGQPWQGNVFMAAGCLDDDPGIRPQRHIFVASKAPWDAITDDLPQFDGYDSGDLGLEREAPPPPSREGAIRGSCLCGRAAFELDAKPAVLVHCHCSRCRKARSAAHNANAFVPSEQLRWLRGSERIRRYKVPDAEAFSTYFCETCGSCMPRPAAEGHATYGIPAGALDDDPGIRPAFHFWCASGAPWFEITDDLPRFDEQPPRESWTGKQGRRA